MKTISVVFLAGDHDRPSGPASIKVPVAIDKPITVKISGEVEEREEEFEFFGYITPLNEKESQLSCIVPPLKARDELETEIPVEAVESDDSVCMDKISENQIDVKIGGKIFTSFHYNEGSDANRPYLYPLMAPSGVGVTRSLPKDKKEGDTKDHPHHKSCWTAWGEVNGADNWAYGRGKARQKVDSIEIEENAVFGKLTLKNTWVTKWKKPQLKETRQIWFYNMDDVKIVDFEISLKSTKGDVKFGDTKEGGFLSVRVATPMDVPRGGKIENSFGGVSEEECWGKRAQWCDYSGEVDGKKVGVAILDNVDNVNFPTYWHVRDYGLMAANPFGLSYFIGKHRNGSYILKDNDELVFRYRLVVHDGDAKEAQLTQHYLNYYVPWKTAIF